MADIDIAKLRELCVRGSTTVDRLTLQVEMNALLDALEQARKEWDDAHASWDARVAELTKASYAQVSLVTNRLHEVEFQLSRARAAAQVYTERVEALGLAADDNDPKVMATAGLIGEAQADLYAALGLLVCDENGEVATKEPVESVEQLRAERDSARMLAEVRGVDSARLRAELAKYEAVIQAAREWRTDEQTEPATMAEDRLAAAIDALDSKEQSR